MTTCPVCRIRPSDPTTRPDAQGAYWCAQCLDEFDATDWDAISDARLDQGGAP